MALDPWWKNLFDNVATVQFDHRVLAITTFTLIVAFWLRIPKDDLPGRARKGVNALLHTGILQVALGIATLLLVVPIPLAAAHQGVAMVLFTVALFLTHALRRP
jgi:cytochrome c oxidase assembly protein subunit 15